MNEMLTTKHVDDFIVTEKNGEESVSIGNLGQRRLKQEILAEPAVDFDLSEGYEHWKDKDRSLKRLGVLFDYLIKKSPEGNLAEVLNGANIVTRRGVLTQMATGKNMLKHRGKDDWQVVCERRKGVIFMEQEMLPKELEMRKKLTEQDKLATFWGYRFEEYMVGRFRSNDTDNNSNNNVNETAPQELRMVMTATLENENHPLILMYSGEVDAVDSDGNYVEIKTLKHRDDQYNYWFKNDKCVKWWLQSRLVDAAYLVVGLRDQAGHVRKLEKMTLGRLYGMQTIQCNGKKCLRFLRDTLATIDGALHEGEAMRVNCTGGILTMTKITSDEADILTVKFINHFKL